MSTCQSVRSPDHEPRRRSSPGAATNNRTRAVHATRPGAPRLRLARDLGAGAHDRQRCSVARAGERAWCAALCAAPLPALLLLSPGAMPAAAEAPTIHLFPSALLEDIKQTGQVAQAMETDLQEIVARLDQQRRLYQESRCEGAASDPGCEQLVRQLGGTYLELLNIMAAQLPAMEQAVTSTHTGLEARLRAELGQKMTPWHLQETLLGQQPNAPQANARPVLRGRSGMRLSERFDQYYRLVAGLGGGRHTHSLAVIAADIYLDMREAAALIARTREEISRATLLEQLNQSFGVITPEMQEVVAGVKTILFGRAEAPPAVAGPPRSGEAREYRSPLSL